MMWVSRRIELYPQNGGQAAAEDAWAVHGIWWVGIILDKVYIGLDWRSNVDERYSFIHWVLLVTLHVCDIFFSNWDALPATSGDSSSIEQEKHFKDDRCKSAMSAFAIFLTLQLFRYSSWSCEDYSFCSFLLLWVQQPWGSFGHPWSTLHPPPPLPSPPTPNPQFHCKSFYFSFWQRAALMEFDFTSLFLRSQFPEKPSAMHREWLVNLHSKSNNFFETCTVVVATLSTSQPLVSLGDKGAVSLLAHIICIARNVLVTIDVQRVLEEAHQFPGYHVLAELQRYTWTAKRRFFIHSDGRLRCLMRKPTLHWLK